MKFLKYKPKLSLYSDETKNTIGRFCAKQMISRFEFGMTIEEARRFLDLGLVYMTPEMNIVQADDTNEYYQYVFDYVFMTKDVDLIWGNLVKTKLIKEAVDIMPLDLLLALNIGALEYDYIMNCELGKVSQKTLCTILDFLGIKYSSILSKVYGDDNYQVLDLKKYSVKNKDSKFTIEEVKKIFDCNSNYSMNNVLKFYEENNLAFKRYWY